MSVQSPQNVMQHQKSKNINALMCANFCILPTFSEKFVTAFSIRNTEIQK